MCSVRTRLSMCPGLVIVIKAKQTAFQTIATNGGSRVPTSAEPRAHGVLTCCSAPIRGFLAFVTGIYETQNLTGCIRSTRMIPLLRLAILHFANQGVRALPLAAVNPSSGSKPTRTKYDIIRSCILTIFACTWVSVHPNIPRRGRDLKWYSTTVHRVRLTVLALVAPELILAWAMREWIVAYKLGKEYRGVHSFQSYKL